MASQTNFMNLFNGFTKFILHSRFHGIMSDSILLISVTGRKTGKTITTPVNYVLTGKEVLITSDLEKSWWLNLRANKSVIILLNNQEVHCEANLIEKADQLIPWLNKYFTGLPSAAKYLKVDRTNDGTFDPQSVQRAAIGRVMIVCTLPK
jgi:deazaflavin-dependent oxidoreductase (nitroreductase family)